MACEEKNYTWNDTSEIEWNIQLGMWCWDDIQEENVDETYGGNPGYRRNLGVRGLQ